MAGLSILRDNVWLLSRLDAIWSKHFPDISQTNRVFIKFGRHAKLRLGSIKQSKHTANSYIVITSMFRKDSVPMEVVDHTIAHELVHYTHGFSSSRPRAHKYPHSGGVVKKEMEGRGMGHLHRAYRAWVKEYRQVLKENYGY